MRPTLHVLRLRNVPIFQQLRMEEVLLRGDSRSLNVLLLNEIMPGDRAVVLGISGKPEVLVHQDAAKADGIPMIKRYSGGGTVFVDHNVKMVSMLINKAALPNVPPYPHDIMKWTERVYRGAFNSLLDSFPTDWTPFSNYQHPGSTPENPIQVRPEFSLVENDYCFGNLKFGGNAQSIARTRWTHHTSLLWNLNVESISKYLKLPVKRPEYRANRPHSSFLCPVAPFFPDYDLPEEAKIRFDEAVIDSLRNYFHVTEITDVNKELELINELSSMYTFQTKYLEFEPTAEPGLPAQQATVSTATGSGSVQG